VFTKYGRYGLPHKRLVQLSDDDTLIQWKDPKKSKEKLRQLCTEDIVSIMIGADHTKVMKKQKIPVEYDNFCMSIITKKRSLDLRFDD